MIPFAQFTSEVLRLLDEAHHLARRAAVDGSWEQALDQLADLRNAVADRPVTEAQESARAALLELVDAESNLLKARRAGGNVEAAAGDVAEQRAILGAALYKHDERQKQYNDRIATCQATRAQIAEALANPHLKEIAHDPRIADYLAVLELMDVLLDESIDLYIAARDEEDPAELAHISRKLAILIPCVERLNEDIRDLLNSEGESNA